MNGPLQRLRDLINKPDPEVPVSRYALAKYLECVNEWNEHYFDDDWCDSARGIDCKSYIEWFAEVYK